MKEMQNSPGFESKIRRYDFDLGLIDPVRAEKSADWLTILISFDPAGYTPHLPWLCQIVLRLSDVVSVEKASTLRIVSNALTFNMR